ncbi:right-handed parallel beta-helix repeat-containing protein [Nocardioides sp. STR2]|uniref:Right-handed parallel beta-helix repeat-containing protein n=1 Tax=Nocardioides pini TaxID=2975053 RepID=A0ABT4CH33_9ACTN|nr:right-handed parallel beta-helix repeat-containing protein [Nocardioides pini]MCY4728101.1 right-handed parallel beta-helix repeat-containing protein [Nocardioides pini]
MTRAGVLAAAIVVAVVASAAPATATPSLVEEGALAPVTRPLVRPADATVGTGTPASCTSRAVVRAVAQGGVIRFDCGPSPVTIAMKRTAKVVNTSSRVVLDGGGLVTLSGEGQRRIIYMNTCDRAQVWTTSHCNDQAEPRLVLRRLRLVGGNSTGEATDGGGGGAVFVRGGRLTIVDSTFADNRCDRTGPDVGGAAVRVLDQHRDRPVVVRRSTFTGGRCSNGSALSSIGVSWRITGSTFTDNRAIGRGANPARPGTPGGGSGGAIYLDGDDIHLSVEDSTITGNRAREGGGAIFFVSNDRTGTLTIDGSRLTDNPSEGFETIPGIFFLGASRTITDSVVR